jgi:hypothetical protein
VCGSWVESGFLDENDGSFMSECFYVCDYVVLASESHLVYCFGRERGDIVRADGEGGDRGGEWFDVVEAGGGEAYVVGCVSVDVEGEVFGEGG